MKAPPLVVFLSILGTAVIAAAPQSPRQMEMGYAMQKAVLRDQDLSEVKNLLQAGFPVDGGIGCGGYTSLDGAVDTKNPEMARLLLRHGARPTARNIVRAAFINSEPAALDIVRQLLKAGASVNARDLYAGRREMQSRPLDQAVWREHASVVKLLLAQKGVEVNYVNVDGNTPLMIAVEKGSRQIVRMLLAAGATPGLETPRKRNAFTASDSAIQNQREIQELLKRPPTTN